MQPHTYTAEVPANARSLRILRAFVAAVLDGAGIDGEHRDRVVLALDEACSNVIKYRCPTIDDGRLHVQAQVGDTDVLRFRVGGFCKPEDVDSIKPRALDDVRPGGLGTAFIGQVMDRVSFEPARDRPQCMDLVMETGMRGSPA